MNSLVSADYGSGSDSNQSDDEHTIQMTNFQSNNNMKNFLRSASDDDSNDDDDDNDSNSSDERSKLNEIKKTILPSASSILLNGSNTGQVFNNPYKKAEIDQIASLEKHVKMVDTDAHTHMKNGKKICWNYRKGRCRFGSNCTYAHDSDLHVNKKLNEMDKDSNGGGGGGATVDIPNTTTTMTTTTTAATPIAPNANVTGIGAGTGGAATAGTIGKLKTKTSNKKRPGLGDSIIPSKKVIKAYNALKKQ